VSFLLIFVPNILSYFTHFFFPFFSPSLLLLGGVGESDGS